MSPASRWNSDASRRCPRAPALLCPGLALLDTGRRGEGFAWLAVSALVTALLVALILLNQLRPLPGLLLLFAGLVMVGVSTRSSQPVSVRLGPGLSWGLASLHALPVVLVLAVLLPDWRLVSLDNPASIPLAMPGEVLACRSAGEPESLVRGELVVVREGDGSAWMGRILGLPGERVQRRKGSFAVDETDASRADSPLGAGDGRSLVVFQLGDRLLTHFEEEDAPALSPLLPPHVVAPGRRYVLALNLSLGGSLDSRRQGAIPEERLQAMDCVLLLSSERPLLIGHPVP